MTQDVIVADLTKQIEAKINSHLDTFVNHLPEGTARDKMRGEIETIFRKHYEVKIIHNTEENRFDIQFVQKGPIDGKNGRTSSETKAGRRKSSNRGNIHHVQGHKLSSGASGKRP
jgi:hypothetical protein